MAVVSPPITCIHEYPFYEHIHNVNASFHNFFFFRECSMGYKKMHIRRILENTFFVITYERSSFYRSIDYGDDDDDVYNEDTTRKYLCFSY